MKKDNDYITKQAIEQEKVLGFNGLIPSELDQRFSS